MKYLRLMFLITSIAMSVNESRAGDNASSEGTISPPSPMLGNATVRSAEGLGSSVEAYGGITAFQDGTLKITSPGAPGAEVHGSSESRLGGVGGVKLGFTWPSFDSIGNYPITDSTPQLCEPSLALDLFWTGYRYKAHGSGTTSSGGVTGSYDGSIESDINTLTFCAEPTVKFNLGDFRPYVGLGLGGTYVEADHAHLDGNVSVLGLGSASGGTDLTGSSDDFDFTAEGLAGFEYFLTSHWALNFDYKYVYLVSPTFHGGVPGSTIKYHLDGLGESLFTGGFSYYF